MAKRKKTTKATLSYKAALQKLRKENAMVVVPDEYPWLIKLQYFMPWDSDQFAKDNGLSKRVSVAQVRKYLRQNAIELALASTFLDGKYGANPKLAIQAMKNFQSEIRRKLAKKTQGQKDMILAKFYINAVKEYAKRESSLKAWRKKHPKWDKIPKKSTKKSTTSSKTKTSKKKPAKKQGTVYKAFGKATLSPSDLKKEAGKYSRSRNKRKAYPKLVSKYGRAGASRIVKKSKRLK